VLLWPEQVVGRGDTAPSNNFRAACFRILQIKAVMKLFPASRGGEGEKRCQAVCGAAPLLLAGHGGEEGWRCAAVTSLSCGCFGPPLLGPFDV
jgi:hypothetical protein